MIIFGASGDLTKRKLMPALYSLYREKRLTGEFSILGIGRTVYSDDNYRSYILEELQQFVKSEEQDTALMASFVSHLYYLPMDPAKAEGYQMCIRDRHTISPTIFSGSDDNTRTSIRGTAFPQEPGLNFRQSS